MKPKKCKNPDCKKFFEPIRPLQKACSVECAYKLGQPVATKERDKKWRKEKKVLKEKLKRVQDYRSDARKIFQRWIRIRDLGKKCISCPVLLTDIREYDAGHYYSAYHYKNLVFDERNCNGQCVQCNHRMSGNPIEYRKGIQQRYGADILLDLEKLADDKTTRILTKEYYIEITEKYKRLVKELES